MEVAHLPGAGLSVFPRSAARRVDPWSQRLPDRLETANSLGIPTDHQAKTTVESVDPSARSDVEIDDLSFGQTLLTGDVVFEKAVAAVNDDVAGIEQRGELVER